MSTSRRRSYGRRRGGGARAAAGGAGWEGRGGGGRAGCWSVGGGSPKNFLLQTEPQIQEVLGLSEAGHDYFLQMTDARPDTGGLSGATPGEAASRGTAGP